MAEMTPETARKIFETMLRIRMFEEKAMDLFQQGLMPGFLHVCIDQEAIAAGVSAALRPEDHIISTHRGHGHIIAKGGDYRYMMAELYAKRTGYCKGKGGSMHIADMSLGILGDEGLRTGWQESGPFPLGGMSRETLEGSKQRCRLNGPFHADLRRPGHDSWNDGAGR